MEPLVCPNGHPLILSEDAVKEIRDGMVGNVALDVPVVEKYCPWCPGGWVKLDLRRFRAPSEARP